MVSVLLVSCGIFETRDPEQPGQSGSNFVPPTEPSLVFSNMENAFRDMNAVNYLRSFSDLASANRNFVFEPTFEAQQSYGGVFAEWTRDDEQKYFDNVKSNVQSGQTPTLNFSEPILTLQGDSAQYEATYRLTIPQAQTNIQVAEGRAYFYLIADKAGTWVVWRWVDTAPPDSFAWSDVKGQFGQ